MWQTVPLNAAERSPSWERRRFNIILGSAAFISANDGPGLSSFHQYGVNGSDL
jgi:hypothetical protein